MDDIANSWCEDYHSSVSRPNAALRAFEVNFPRHAAYQYSGPTAAYAYKCLDLKGINRIFLLGPSHKLALRGCAISSHTYYETPLGDLVLDQETINSLKATGKFASWKHGIEEAEHSLEMHLPYIYKMCSQEKTFSSPSKYPLLIPILVGELYGEDHETYGSILAEYMMEPDTAFIVSSDFCHWGKRSFDYTYYIPAAKGSALDGYNLRSSEEAPTDPPIYESIRRLDMSSMGAVEGGKLADFLANLRRTKNTVCGRHPIALVMAALEELRNSGKLEEGKGLFKLLEYQQSSQVEDIHDSSVSYVSAVALL
jgi:AmmeMemoRadiSam system protein B